MGKCAKCGAETQLHVNGVPLCIECDRVRALETAEKGEADESSRAGILRSLQDKLREAREWRERASARFEEVTRAGPSGLPYPDSVDRIKAASNEYTLALNAFNDALKEQNDYIVHGKIPPGLEQRKPPGETGEKAS